jgi:membrane-associated protease RseP (regulator of RpoE activity)
MLGHMLRILPFLCVAAVAAGDADYEEADDPGARRAGWGAWMVPVPIERQIELDLEPGQGLMAVRVRPGGTADTLGVDPGDVVTALDGRPVSTRRDIRRVARASEAGDPLAVQIVDDAGVAQRSGGWQARRQRPPGQMGPPPWAAGGGGPGGDPWAALGLASPPLGIDEQRARLADEQAAIARTITTLESLGDLPQRSAWTCSATVAHRSAP